MYIDYEEDMVSSVRFSQFVNHTYSISGSPVTYLVYMDEEQLYNFSWCGDNLKNKFTRPNMNLQIVMEPSYKIGEEMLDDIHLSIACTKGSVRYMYFNECKIQIPNRLRGYCTGQIGCNCKAWGHVSPTRFWGYFGPSFVTDVASISGQMTLKWNSRESRR